MVYLSAAVNVHTLLHLFTPMEELVGTAHLFVGAIGNSGEVKLLDLRRKWMLCQMFFFYSPVPQDGSVERKISDSEMWAKAAFLLFGFRKGLECMRSGERTTELGLPGALSQHPEPVCFLSSPVLLLLVLPK